MKSARRLGAGVFLTVPAAVLIALSAASAVFAASPSPTGIGGDTRSSGEGPGLVGEPLVAIAIVVVIALVSVGASLIYVRITASRSR